GVLGKHRDVGAVLHRHVAGRAAVAAAFLIMIRVGAVATQRGGFDADQLVGRANVVGDPVGVDLTRVRHRHIVAVTAIALPGGVVIVAVTAPAAVAAVAGGADAASSFRALEGAAAL